MAQIINKKSMVSLLNKPNPFASGCLIDTSILFGATIDTDMYHEDALEIINLMIQKNIPRFINANIRSEFLNNVRRIIIAEAAVALYEDYGSILPIKIYNKLRSLHQRAKDSTVSGKAFRVQEEEIKQIKKLFLEEGSFFEEPIWDLFCSSYLIGKLHSEWTRAEVALGINTISFSTGEYQNILKTELIWDEVIRIMESTGTASSDSMIINLFNASNINLIITSDEDFADVVTEMTESEKVVCYL